MDDIEQKVKKIIAEQLGIKEEDIKNESSFIEDLGADSLTTVEMSLALEDAFDIEIPDTEQENLRTVQHLKELGIDITYFETPGYRLRQGRRREVIRTFGQRLEASCR